MLEKSSKKITIAYGTETGNSKKIATDLAAKAKKQNLIVKVVSLDQYRLTDLSKELYFFTVISTQGEGEPPTAAKKFYDHIHQNELQLNALQYSVLALGDTSYPLYCKAGEDVDNQLSNLGGNRLVPIQKCDVDFDADAELWVDRVLNSLLDIPEELVAAKPIETTKPAGKVIHQGVVLSHINLNDRGSNKETYHIEISADGVVYEAGDSIGIVPKNHPEYVSAIINLVSIEANDTIQIKTESFTILDALTNKLNIANLSEKVVKRYAEMTQLAIPASRFDFLDLLQQYPVKNAAQFKEVLQILNPQSPRLYTVASSPIAHTDEVHITVARDTFWVDTIKKYGVCSDFLSQIEVSSTLDFFVQKNKRFKLPSTDKDIIMIGPGTGIAAFRSFLAERDANGATGRNWLFFGEQYFAADFLYQTELQNWVATGVLTKLNVAFSRDQPKKIYVQDRMLENAVALFEWLEAGASVFVCGKKDPMSTDVENTLLQIIEQEGKKSAADAKAYLELLKEQHRYHKDVY